MTLLLIIIYVAFISLGLPDAVLGAVWPEMRVQLGVPLSYAGVVSTIVCCGTVASSLLSTWFVRRLKTKGVTVISVVLTAGALFGYSQTRSFWWLCLMAIPLGIGAGSIDAALNNFVALHYKARQMSWLHCFWGVGATAGPVVLAAFMQKPEGWRMGVGAISAIQFVLVALLVISLPLWKKAEDSPEAQDAQALLSNREALRIPGVKNTALSFFCYSAAELTAGLWASSYLVEQRGYDVATAAGLTSLYYVGIAVGRFVSGLLTERFSSKILIRAGALVYMSGAAVLALPLPQWTCVAGLLLVGLGCAPVFPCMIHETPARFGKQASQAVIGLQMATAYMGMLIMPPILGWLCQTVSMALYPWFLLLLFGSMLLSCMRIDRLMEMKKGNNL